MITLIYSGLLVIAVFLTAAAIFSYTLRDLEAVLVYALLSVAFTVLSITISYDLKHNYTSNKELMSLGLEIELPHYKAYYEINKHLLTIDKGE